MIDLENKSSSRNTLILVGIMLIVFMLITLTIFNYIRTVQKNELARVETRLSDFSRNNISLIRVTIESIMNQLKTNALIVERYGDLRSAKIPPLLKQLAHKNEYDRLAIDFVDGVTWTSDGYVFDVTHLNYLDKIRKGTPFVSDVIFSLADSRPTINFFVPMYDANRNVVAALRLTMFTERFSDIINKTQFDTDIYYHLIDNKGEYLAYQQTRKAIFPTRNFFDSLPVLDYDSGYSTEQIRDFFDQQKAGFSYYTANGHERVAYLEPVGMNDWMLMTIAPQDVISKSKQQNVSLAVTMTVQVSLLLMVVFIWLYFMQRRARQTALLNERCFRILAKQTNRVIMEWDFATSRLTSATNFKEIFGREMVTRSSLEEMIQAKTLHPDDIPLAKQSFEMLLRGEPVDGIKFRLLHQDGTFHWCTMSFITVRNANGKPLKAFGTLEDINESILREESLKQRAESDPLTGLYNKTTTERLIRHELEEGQRTQIQPNTIQEYGALMIVDIDNFKEVNDLLGHQFGDKILKELSHDIRMLFRSTDIIGRIGGDEFFVFLKNAHNQGLITARAQEICNLFNKTYTDNGIQCKISASIGISFFPEHGITFEALYRKADIALYRTKEKGKNGYSIYDGIPTTQYVSQRTAIDSLQNSLPPSFES